MMLLRRLDAIKNEMLTEMRPYLFHVAVVLLVLYVVHQCISYVLQKRAIKKGTLAAMREYETRKKQ